MCTSTIFLFLQIPAFFSLYVFAEKYYLELFIHAGASSIHSERYRINIFYCDVSTVLYGKRVLLLYRILVSQVFSLSLAALKANAARILRTLTHKTFPAATVSLYRETINSERARI